VVYRIESERSKTVRKDYRLRYLRAKPREQYGGKVEAEIEMTVLDSTEYEAAYALWRLQRLLKERLEDTMSEGAPPVEFYEDADPTPDGSPEDFRTRLEQEAAVKYDGVTRSKVRFKILDRDGGVLSEVTR
jgi:hypothetical protein